MKRETNMKNKKNLSKMWFYREKKTVIEKRNWLENLNLQKYKILWKKIINRIKIIIFILDS